MFKFSVLLLAVVTSSSALADNVICANPFVPGNMAYRTGMMDAQMGLRSRNYYDAGARECYVAGRDMMDSEIGRAERLERRINGGGRGPVITETQKEMFRAGLRNGQVFFQIPVNSGAVDNDFYPAGQALGTHRAYVALRNGTYDVRDCQRAFNVGAEGGYSTEPMTTMCFTTGQWQYGYDQAMNNR